MSARCSFLVQSPLSREGLLRQSVVTCHPVWKDIVDRGGFNRAGSSPEQQKWAALPEEIGIDAIVNSNWDAGSIGAARRISVSQIDPIVAPPPQVPRILERDLLTLARANRPP